MDEQPTMVDKMFRYGLSPTLCSCLGPMVKDLPELLGEVQGKRSPSETIDSY